MTDGMDEVRSSTIDIEESSYEEVEGVISNHDDPTILCLTFRACFLGCLLTTLRSIYETYMAYRTIPIYLESICYYVLAYPLGKLLELILPCRTWTRWRLSLNPGPFTIKEHALAGIMAFSTDPVGLIQEFGLKQIFLGSTSIHVVPKLVYIISNLLLGFGLAGILRRFLIWPSNMIWPSSLLYVSVLRVLHETDTKDLHARRTISRLKLFILLTIIQFTYSWLPHYVMPILKQFAWLCMIFPTHKVLAQLTGAQGFGMTSLQFDWYSLTEYLNSPVIVPRWAQVNLCVGFFLFTWLAGPLIYFFNLWDARNLPIGSNNIFTPTGAVYDPGRVVDNSTHLNMTAFNEYNQRHSPVRFSTMYIIFLATNLAFLPALLMHTLLHHGQWIKEQFRTSFSKRNNDVHCKLMAHYLETPEWCFVALFIVCLVTATLVSHFTEILPGYYVLLGVSIACITILPNGILVAQTAQRRLIVISVPSFLLGAVLMPSDRFGLYAFVDFVIRIQDQALNILLFLKISHFMKLPPRAVFATVILSTILSAIVAYFTSEYLVLNMPMICQLGNHDWKCTTVMATYVKASFLSIIHPSLLFGKHSGIYHPLIWCILIGALLPIPFWFLSRRYPTNNYIEFIHIPLILGVCTYWYHQPLASLGTWLLLGFIASFVLRRWWYRRYALISSVALTIGASITVLCVHFIFTTQHKPFPTWWGTGGQNKDHCSSY